MKKQRYFIQTYGCQMNVRDSELAAAQLDDQGLEQGESLDDADIVFVNTCSVRDKAEQKLYSDLGRLRTWKTDGKGRRIVVGGCVAQQERDRIGSRAPHVDLIVGTHQIRALGTHLLEAEKTGQQGVQTEWKHSDPVERLGRPDPVRESKPSVFVTIQEGCDNVCTFCIVPFTRGREVSRPAAAILEEVRQHVDRGAREIVLLGQNVNSYGHKFPEFPSFAELLYQVHDIEGVQRIRFTSPHPKDYGADVIQAYRDLPNLCPSAHLPVQAGSDRILSAMRRGYTQQKFLQIVADLKQARPDIHISTDIIVGFPGEQRTDFEQTLLVMDEVRFSQVYAFVYSARPMTPGKDLADPVSQADKKAWLHELFAHQQQIQESDHQQLIGTRTSVLFTDHRDGRLKGRSPQGRVVHVVAPATRIGQIGEVEIDVATANALYGHLPGSSRFKFDDNPQQAA